MCVHILRVEPFRYQSLSVAANASGVPDPSTKKKIAVSPSSSD